MFLNAEAGPSKPTISFPSTRPVPASTRRPSGSLSDPVDVSDDELLDIDGVLGLETAVAKGHGGSRHLSKMSRALTQLPPSSSQQQSLRSSTASRPLLGTSSTPIDLVSLSSASTTASSSSKSGSVKCLGATTKSAWFGKHRSPSQAERVKSPAKARSGAFGSHRKSGTGATPTRDLGKGKEVAGVVRTAAGSATGLSGSVKKEVASPAMGVPARTTNHRHSVSPTKVSQQPVGRPSSMQAFPLDSPSKYDYLHPLPNLKGERPGPSSSRATSPVKLSSSAHTRASSPLTPIPTSIPAKTAPARRKEPAKILQPTSSLTSLDLTPAPSSSRHIPAKRSSSPIRPSAQAMQPTSSLSALPTPPASTRHASPKRRRHTFYPPEDEESYRPPPSSASQPRLLHLEDFPPASQRPRRATSRVEPGAYVIPLMGAERWPTKAGSQRTEGERQVALRRNRERREKERLEREREQAEVEDRSTLARQDGRAKGKEKMKEEAAKEEMAEELGNSSMLSLIELEFSPEQTTKRSARRRRQGASSEEEEDERAEAAGDEPLPRRAASIRSAKRTTKQYAQGRRMLPKPSEGHRDVARKGSEVMSRTSSSLTSLSSDPGPGEQLAEVEEKVEREGEDDEVKEKAEREGEDDEVKEKVENSEEDEIDLLEMYGDFDFTAQSPLANPTRLPTTPTSQRFFRTSATPHSPARRPPPLDILSPHQPRQDQLLLLSPSARHSPLSAKRSLSPLVPTSVVSPSRRKAEERAAKLEQIVAQANAERAAEEEAIARRNEDRRSKWERIIAGGYDDEEEEEDEDEEEEEVEGLGKEVKSLSDVFAQKSPSPEPVRPLRRSSRTSLPPAAAAAPPPLPQAASRSISPPDTRLEKLLRQAKRDERRGLSGKDVDATLAELDARRRKEVPYPTPDSRREAESADKDGDVDGVVDADVASMEEGRMERLRLVAEGQGLEVDMSMLVGVKEQRAQVEWAGFWADGEWAPRVDVQVPELELHVAGDKGVEGLLVDAAARRDTLTISMLLSSGCLDDLLNSREKVWALANWLLALAFASPGYESLHAHQTLLHLLRIAPPTQENHAWGRRLYSLFRALGASEEDGIEAAEESVFAVGLDREEACERLISVIVASAEANWFRKDDMEYAILRLAHMHLDHRTSARLRMAIDEAFVRLVPRWVINYGEQPHMCAMSLLRDAVKLPEEVRARVLMILGERTKEASAVSKILAAGLLVPQSVDKMGDVIDEKHQRVSIDFSLVQRGARRLLDEVAVREPDHAKISDMITCLHICSNDMDALVANTPSVGKEVEQSLTTLATMLARAHNHIKLHAMADPLAGFNKSRLSHLGAGVKMLGEVAIRRREKAQRAKTMRHLEEGEGGQLRLSFGKKADVQTDGGGGAEV